MRDSDDIGALPIVSSLPTDACRHTFKSKGRKCEPMTEEIMEEALLEHAVKNGFLTFDELYETFPPVYCDVEDLWVFLALLEDLGINVVETQEYIGPGVRKKQRAA
jgi:hypothetical protein